MSVTGNYRITIEACGPKIEDPEKRRAAELEMARIVEDLLGDGHTVVNAAFDMNVDDEPKAAATEPTG